MPVQNNDADVISISSNEADDQYTLDRASRTQLKLAIANAPEERVREAFAALVDRVPTIPDYTFRMLVALQRPTTEDEDDEDEEESEDHSSGVETGTDETGYYNAAPGVQSQVVNHHATTRRTVLVPRWMICAKCEEEFDAGEIREHGECNYHSGDLECNEEAFLDWDENCHGPMDCDENRQDYPENFIWNCCDRDGTEPGCESDRHEPQQGRQKKTRYY